MEAAQTERIASLFRGLERAHGIYELAQKKTGGKKVQGKARTVRGAVTLDLWAAHLGGKQGLGIVPITDEATCFFGAIDVDRYDISIEAVELRCSELNLPLLPTRSKSGGVHLYAFGREALPAELLKARLEEWSVALGFGGAEVFPKQAALLSDKDVGNWINMPYFGIEAGTTERYGIYKGQPLGFEDFCVRAEQLQLTAEQLEQLQIAEGEDFIDGPPCLQSIARSGFPEGSRNKGLFAIGVYLKQRYPDEWPAQLLLYNARYMKPPLAEGEVKDSIKSLKRKEYNYSCNEPPIKSFCNRNLCRTREFGVGKGSEDWGLQIDSDVQKIMTEPPYWIITVNGARMQVFSEDLQQQRRFIDQCINKLNFHPAPLPADKWRGEVNKILRCTVEVEAPPDSGIGGELECHLRQFCTTGFPQGDTREELLSGHPWTEEGTTYFRSADFKKYLDAHHFRGLSGARLYARLRQGGLIHKQLWVNGQNLQVWATPAFPKAPEGVVPERKVDKGGM
jgi:hypothetical protein